MSPRLITASGDILCSATTANKHAVTALYLCTWSPVIYNYESIIHTSIKSLDFDHGHWIECVCIPSANHCELLTTGHEVATATIIGSLECIDMLILLYPITVDFSHYFLLLRALFTVGQLCSILN